MATLYTCPTMGLFSNSKRKSSSNLIRLNFFKHLKPIVRKRHTANIRASSTTIVETKQPEPISNEKVDSTRKSILACPICYEQLVQKREQGSQVESTTESTLYCNTCKKSYFNKEAYLDLSVASSAKEYTESPPAATELFRTPLISFLYERGWRQNFVWGGFPGPQKEFEMATDYFKPVLGGNIVDASCGSGPFSRLFAKSGVFSHVVALDYSENMLRQCYEFINQEEGIPKEVVTLVKADISRLPFVSSSVDALHAGAALHCWPSPSAAIAEISRVLRPGGVFVATTYIPDVFYPAIPVLQILRPYVGQIAGSQIFLSEGELEDLCKTCGLVGFTCVRNGFFIMLSATKPS